MAARRPRRASQGRFRLLFPRGETPASQQEGSVSKEEMEVLHQRMKVEGSMAFQGVDPNPSLRRGRRFYIRLS